MGFDLSFLKRYFKIFYGLILGFVAITVFFFIVLYWNRLSTFKDEVYDLQSDFISIFTKDFDSVKKDQLTKEFYEKYSSAHLKFIENVIIVNTDGSAFFTANSEKSYQFIGMERKGTIMMEGVTLRNNLVSQRTMKSGLSIYVLTSEDFVRSTAFDKWLQEQRLHFSLSVLVPLLIMLLLMMIEDKIIKEIEGKLNSAFELARSHEAAKDELYSGLFFQNRSIMLLINPESGLVVKGNESAKRYYGYNFAEEIIHISQINTMPANVLKDVMEGAIVMHKNYFQFQHRLKNGQIRDVEVYSGPVMIDGEKLLCSIVHDITDKIKAEHQLLVQKQEMQQSLQSKSQILATISHEIKTPITGILQNIQELGTSLKDATVLRQLDFLKYNVDSLNRLVFDLLDYARLDAGGIRLYSTPFDIVDCLEDTMRLFRPIAKEKRIRMALEIEGLQKTKYIGDRFRITQILNNLVSNSLKYTHDGMVTLRANSETFDKVSLLTIEVMDTGIGMSEEVIAQIFNPYYTTDETGEHKGTGLGLGICRMIVQAMDGTLDIASTPEQGTNITLVLELENDEASELSIIDLQGAYQLDRQERKLTKGMYHVLLVDDDAMNLIFLEKLLKNISETNISTETAYNGDEALKMLQQTRFSHVLSDYQLPDTDGIRLFSDIKAQCQNQPCPTLVLMSADTVDVEMNGDGFLLKPIELSKLKTYFETVVATETSVDLSDKLRSHVYLGYKEWAALNDQMQTNELDDVLKIFARSLTEKMKLLPKELSEDDRDKILKILHAIKGSISYFRSDSFLMKLIDVENAIKEGVEESSINLYSAFLIELRQFVAEADYFTKHFIQKQ